MVPDVLFSGPSCLDHIEHTKQQLQAEISRMPDDKLLNTNPDDLIGYLLEKYGIDIPVLDEAGMSLDYKDATQERHDVFVHHRGERIRVKGLQITITLPFNGDAGFFGIRPSTFHHSPPRAEIRNNHLIGHFFAADGESETSTKGRIDGWVNDIKQFLSWLQQSYSQFSASLQPSIQSMVTERRQRLLAQAKMAESLGIRLSVRPGAQTQAPVVRKKFAPTMPPSSPGKYQPEPVIEEQTYQDILNTMDNMLRVMELSPSAFKAADEETIRMHFLVQLNGTYKGAATAETFNFSGKTDILIRENGRNIFIAECKFWKGPESLISTIDQICGYLSWRDTKTAILLFNRAKDFSRVITAIKDTVPKHPLFVREIGKRSETSYQYTLKHRQDPAKHLTLTVMAYDIPTVDK